MIKRIFTMAFVIGFMPLVMAENLTGAERFLCATTQVSLCFETGDCYEVLPQELNIPEFLKVDMRKNLLSTTEGSGMQRVSEFSASSRQDGLVTAQGVEQQRAFSLVIHEATGLLTASVALDGYAVSAFGNCTVN